jgi:polyhydroxyalkanoate synthesis regulator phasin
VHVHNKLALGPRSVCSIGANNLLLKVWLASVAISETNACLTHSRDNNLTSDVNSHGDFKTDSGNELVQRAQQAQESVDEGPRIQTRESEESVATRVPGPQRNQMLPALREHTLKHDARKNRKCMVCGT